MAEGAESGLETAAIRGFDCASFLSKDQKIKEYRLHKQTGVQAYEAGDFVTARSCFKMGIPKAESRRERSSLCRLVIKCSREIMAREGATPQTFAAICRDYEALVIEQETPENFMEYIGFVADEMMARYNQNLENIALKIGTDARLMFPEDARIYAALNRLYKESKENRLAHECTVTAMKLQYEDPESLFENFGTDLFEPLGNDPEQNPFTILLKTHGATLRRDIPLLQKYCKYMSDNCTHMLTTAVQLLFAVYELKPEAKGLKEDIYAVYEKAQQHVSDYNITMPAGLEEAFNKIEEIKKEDKARKERRIVTTADVSYKKIKCLSPKEIRYMLARRIEGQDSALTAVAVAAHNHLRRIDIIQKGETIRKSNLLLMGPSGAGKTLTVESLADVLNKALGEEIPVWICDASVLVEHGYVGTRIQEEVARLYQQTGCDKEKTERAIIYIDEIDKKQAAKDSATKDVSGAGAQQQLLGPLDGAPMDIELKQGYNTKTIRIDTSNMMFILGGAFSSGSLEGIIKERLKQEQGGMGFGKERKEYDNERLLHQVTTADLFGYGLMKEIIGRVHTIAIYDKLSKSELRRILIDPEGALIPEYQMLFREDGIDLEITEEAMETIAEEAHKTDTGARALQKICIKVLQHYQYAMVDPPGRKKELKKLRIGKEEVLGILKEEQGMNA